LVDHEVKGRVESLALVAAQFALERLDLWVVLMLVAVLEELLDLVRLDGLIRRAVCVPAARVKAEVRLGDTHEADVAGAHDAGGATDANHRQQRPVLHQSAKLQ